MNSSQQPEARWNETDSRTFLTYGHVFTPHAATQKATICALLPTSQPLRVLELGCGAGLLAEAILQQHPHAAVLGYDGSPTMLQHASERLRDYGSRFQPMQFDLGDVAWRSQVGAVDAVVSSLVIHHLYAHQKQQLFRDLYALLQPGGVLVIADVVAPADARGAHLAADAWDAAVREQAVAYDPTLQAFELFEREHWNMYRYPEPDSIDHPSTLLEQLHWLGEAGFAGVDVYWMDAGHAIFGGHKLISSSS